MPTGTGPSPTWTSRQTDAAGPPRLAGLLSDSRITRIFTSDAVRTHQTAAPTAQQYRAAFTTPADYTCGNSGLNILRGPGFSEPEFALEKSLLVKEGKSLTFRAEDTDALNHVNLGQPSATLGAAGFGTILGINGQSADHANGPEVRVRVREVRRAGKRARATTFATIKITCGAIV